MEGKGMGRGMLGMEIPLHQHHQMIPFVADHHSSHQQQHHQARKQQSLYGYERKSKEQGGLSDGEEEGKQVSSCSSPSPSPWHRMKWTDSMVRLLVMAVYYVGGDDGGEGTSTEKKKGGGNCSLLSSQKKGKWKSVSRAMMEKGFYVSPQQCEDKFNDLNKRYKRVNEILGKGTACRVVENHALLDAMEQIPQKLKEEVRKLLNSKHLFFREMCAYHSSFATTATSARHQSDSLPLQQQRCFHDEEKRERGGQPATEEYEVDDAGATGDESEDEDEEEGEEEEEEDEEEEEEEEKDDEEIENGHQYHEEDEEEGEEKGRRKRQKVALEILQQLKFEVGKVVEDGSKGLWEQREWLMKRCEEVEEQRVGYERQALELEKQRFKWLKYSSKKEREMEKMKLENQRRRLENDRMLLLLRNKELELNLLQNHNTNKRPDPSFIPAR